MMSGARHVKRQPLEVAGLDAGDDDLREGRHEAVDDAGGDDVEERAHALARQNHRPANTMVTTTEQHEDHDQLPIRDRLVGGVQGGDRDEDEDAADARGDGDERASASADGR